MMELCREISTPQKSPPIAPQAGEVVDAAEFRALERDVLERAARVLNKRAKKLRQARRDYYAGNGLEFGAGLELLDETAAAILALGEEPASTMEDETK